jgi:hypothetical protein
MVEFWKSSKEKGLLRTGWSMETDNPLIFRGIYYIRDIPRPPMRSFEEPERGGYKQGVYINVEIYSRILLTNFARGQQFIDNINYFFLLYFCLFFLIRSLSLLIHRSWNIECVEYQNSKCEGIKLINFLVQVI